MSSLFKTIDSEGNVKFDDNNRIICIDVHTQVAYRYKFIQNIVDEMFPITMPYMPMDNCIRVYCESLLMSEDNGDFDTVGVFCARMPDGEKIPINRFFAEDGCDMREITKEEYENRKKQAIRIERG